MPGLAAIPEAYWLALAAILAVGVLGWVPGASHQTLGACIFSYNGQVRVGFKADSTVIPDVANLVAALDEEMTDLFAESPNPVGAPAEAG